MQQWRPSSSSRRRQPRPSADCTQRTARAWSRRWSASRIADRSRRAQSRLLAPPPRQSAPRPCSPPGKRLRTSTARCSARAKREQVESARRGPRSRTALSARHSRSVCASCPAAAISSRPTCHVIDNAERESASTRSPSLHTTQQGPWRTLRRCEERLCGSRRSRLCRGSRAAACRAGH